MFNWPGWVGDMFTISVQPTGGGKPVGWMLPGVEATTFDRIVPTWASGLLTLNTFGSKSTAKSARLSPIRVELTYAVGKMAVGREAKGTMIEPPGLSVS